MLIGIDPRLNADLLRALRAMGHGDTIVLADTNFPAESMARHTVVGRPLALENVDLPGACDAVLSVMPLDGFVPDWGATMQVVDDADAVPEVVGLVRARVRAAGETRDLPTVERFAFYDLARSAFAIVRTGETRLYGNLMLRKGVLRPDG